MVESENPKMAASNM